MFRFHFMIPAFVLLMSFGARGDCDNIVGVSACGGDKAFSHDFLIADNLVSDYPGFKIHRGRDLKIIAPSNAFIKRQFEDGKGEFFSGYENQLMFLASVENHLKKSKIITALEEGKELSDLDFGRESEYLTQPFNYPMIGVDKSGTPKVIAGAYYRGSIRVYPAILINELPLILKDKKIKISSYDRSLQPVSNNTELYLNGDPSDPMRIRGNFLIEGASFGLDAANKPKITAHATKKGGIYTYDTIKGNPPPSSPISAAIFNSFIILVGPSRIWADGDSSTNKLTPGQYSNVYNLVFSVES